MRSIHQDWQRPRHPPPHQHSHQYRVQREKLSQPEEISTLGRGVQVILFVRWLLLLDDCDNVDFVIAPVLAASTPLPAVAKHPPLERKLVAGLLWIHDDPNEKIYV